MKWAFIMKFGHQGFAALITLVLMGILGPEQYGVLGMAWLYILFIELILDQGFGAAIIQRKDLQQKHMESAFWLVLGVSIVLTGASIGFSGWWARWNNEEILQPVISVLSIVIPIQGLTTVQVAVLQRALDFKALAIRNLTSVLLGGGVGIGMALAGFGVWALVGQQLTFAVVALLLLWTLSGWRPRLKFSRAATKDLLGFSVGTFLAKLGVFVANRADEILIGLFFGSYAVGIYRSAGRLMNMMVDLGTRAIGIASFPKFSRSQGDREQLRKDVGFCFRLSSLLVIPGLALLAGASDALMAALGEKWRDSADVLKVLCLVGVAQALTTFAGPMLQGVGKAHSFAALVWGTALVSNAAFVTVGLLLKEQPESIQPLGMAATRGGLYVLIFLPVAFWIIRALCGFSLGEFFRSIRVPLLAGIACFGAIRGLVWTEVLLAWNPWLRLITECALGGGIAAGFLLALDSTLRDKLRPFVRARV